MRGMHEFHVETLVEPFWKILQCRWRGFHIGMTDRAHGLLFRISELTDMTADARIVTGEFQIERLTFAPVT